MDQKLLKWSIGLLLFTVLILGTWLILEIVQTDDAVCDMPGILHMEFKEGIVINGGPEFMDPLYYLPDGSRRPEAWEVERIDTVNRPWRPSDLKRGYRGYRRGGDATLLVCSLDTTWCKKQPVFVNIATSFEEESVISIVCREVVGEQVGPSKLRSDARWGYNEFGEPVKIGEAVDCDCPPGTMPVINPVVNDSDPPSQWYTCHKVKLVCDTTMLLPLDSTLY